MSLHLGCVSEDFRYERAKARIESGCFCPIKKIFNFFKKPIDTKTRSIYNIIISIDIVRIVKCRFQKNVNML